MHVLWMKDDRLPKIVFFGQSSRVNSAVGMGGCHKERFKGNWYFLGLCKEGDFE